MAPGETTRTAESPWLHEEVGRRMAQRLQWIKAQPRSWLDWAPLRGGVAAHRLVAERYRTAAVHVFEPGQALRAATRQALAAPWWRIGKRHGADLRFELPSPGGVDLLWSNMSLHTSADPQALIDEWQQLIASDGFLMFSCLGPDTLRELHTIYRRQGWPPPGPAFTDMHDWGDMLVAAGFAEPVMDMERVVLTYSSPQAALAELRGLGRNLHPQRFAGLRGRAWQAALLGQLDALRAHESGDDAADIAVASPENSPRFALTFEIIYGHAFKPQPRIPLAGETAVSLERMRAMLGHGGRSTSASP